MSKKTVHQFCVVFFCLYQYLWAMGTTPEPTQETQEQTDSCSQAPEQIEPNISQEVSQTSTAQNIPEVPAPITLNTKPVETEIQIRSDIKEQLRWLHKPGSSKTQEQYVLIKLNEGQTEAQLNAQTNTKNFVYLDPSHPDTPLENGLFFWKQDEQTIETAWGELYLLRTNPESLYTCAFRTATESPENTETDTQDSNPPENIKEPTPQPEKAWDNKYCVFREKDNLWRWEEPIEQARQKFPDFDKELKGEIPL